MEGPGTVMRTQDNFGGMTVRFNELPKGTDFTPLLNGLDNNNNNNNNNSCHCPHWGYVLSGKLLVKYDDGKEETLSDDAIYYLPNGHTAIVQEDVKLIEFSPSKAFNDVMTHVGKKMAELGG